MGRQFKGALLDLSLSRVPEETKVGKSAVKAYVSQASGRDGGSEV